MALIVLQAIREMDLADRLPQRIKAPWNSFEMVTLFETVSQKTLMMQNSFAIDCDVLCKTAGELFHCVCHVCELQGCEENSFSEPRRCTTFFEAPIATTWRPKNWAFGLTFRPADPSGTMGVVRTLLGWFMIMWWFCFKTDSQVEPTLAVQVWLKRKAPQERSQMHFTSGVRWSLFRGLEEDQRRDNLLLLVDESWVGVLMALPDLAGMTF